MRRGCALRQSTSKRYHGGSVATTHIGYVYERQREAAAECIGRMQASAACGGWNGTAAAPGLTPPQCRMELAAVIRTTAWVHALRDAAGPISWSRCASVDAVVCAQRSPPPLASRVFLQRPPRVSASATTRSQSGVVPSTSHPVHAPRMAVLMPHCAGVAGDITPHLQPQRRSIAFLQA